MQHPNHTCESRRQGELVVKTCGFLSLNASGSESPLHVVPAGLRVAWDLSLVTDVDAAGLGAVADVARRATEGGGSIYVPAASRVAHRLAALARLDTVVPGAWGRRVVDTSLCSDPRSL
jgi:ABC-type transporter Mla MlaB component